MSDSHSKKHVATHPHPHAHAHALGEGTHPTEQTTNDPLDTPCSTDTAQKLVAHMGLTEREARALLACHGVSEAEVEEALKADLHAIASAMSESTEHTLLTDPKLDLSDDDKSQLPVVAPRVRVLSSAADKVQALHDTAYAEARVDTGWMQALLYRVILQIKSRSRLNEAVRRTYSGLLAYHHARHPGRHRHATAVASVPGTTPVA